MNKYLDKWYVWVCLLIALLFTYGFITAQVYAWHPTEIRIYANDEMVATAKEVFKQMEIDGFNECIINCNENLDCYNFCTEYYKNLGCDKNELDQN